MTGRERIACVLNHKKPDRIPFDLGSTSVTGIEAGMLGQLRKIYDLDNTPVKIHDPIQMLGLLDPDCIQSFSVDCLGLWPHSTALGFANDHWKPWTLWDGSEALIGKGFTWEERDDGYVYAFPGGNSSVAPSVKMPRGGYYFDTILRQEPINEDELDPRRDFQNDFPLFSETALEYLQKSAEFLYRETESAIIGNYFGMALGSPFRLAAAGLERTPGIRKYEDWLAAHYLYPGYVKEVNDFQTERALVNLELYKEAVGDSLSAVVMSGTDFGTQNSEILSPDIFREFYKPYFEKANRWVHENTPWKTFYHCCGSIVHLLDDFVEMGVDILNPVQTSARGMDPEYLMEHYGDDLVFWGGGIDTQKTLPFGTPGEVRDEVFAKCQIFSRKNGFVFNPVHNIQARTPVANVKAMMEALKEYNYADRRYTF